MRLIDEIEAAATNSTGMYSDAGDLMQSDYWPRIKAALEAGEDAVAYIECPNCPQPNCSTCYIVARFRAAAGEGS